MIAPGPPPAFQSAPRSEPLRWLIAGTWDGQPIPEREQAWVALRADAADLVVEVDSPFHGDPPPPGPPGPCDRLWEHEVVELFLVGTPADAEPVPYLEVELSPHGHYLALRFAGVRQVVERELRLPYLARRQGGRWWGVARVPAGMLPPAPWRGNAFAAHGRGSGRRLLALTPVPGEYPDFHRIENFSPLALPRAASRPRSSR